ncbi:MAG: stage III sporulation protein AA [Clostridia bacterium]|nr:stage III sporulation protein AA [Clostridia bacterium]
MQESKDSFGSAADILCDELQAIVRAVPENKRATVQEIRLRMNRPLTLTDGSTTLFPDTDGRIMYSPGENSAIVTQRQIYDTFRRLCGYSVYSVENDIRNGFITVRGGHRVGLCGTAVCSGGKITAVSDISSMNIRVSRQIKGAAKELLSALYPLKGGVLIVGPPASGKTTLLRDLARCLSSGAGCRIMRTVVIDERGEIAGTCHGVPANDLGLCDILNGYPKGEGIMQAVRALSPQVIICDEIGGADDLQSASCGFNAGAVIISSVHASSYEELSRRSFAPYLKECGAFRTAVILDSSDHPCRIKQIIDIEKEPETE